MTIHPPVSSNQLQSSETDCTPQAKKIDSAPQHQKNGSESFIGRYLRANIDWFKFRLVIAGMNTAVNHSGVFFAILWIQRTWRVVKGSLGLGGNGGREKMTSERVGGGDFMQKQVVDMAKEFGVEITEETLRG